MVEKWDFLYVSYNVKNPIWLLNFTILGQPHLKACCGYWRYYVHAHRKSLHLENPMPSQFHLCFITHLYPIASQFHLPKEPFLSISQLIIFLFIYRSFGPQTAPAYPSWFKKLIFIQFLIFFMRQIKNYDHFNFRLLEK